MPVSVSCLGLALALGLGLDLCVWLADVWAGALGRAHFNAGAVPAETCPHPPPRPRSRASLLSH